MSITPSGGHAGVEELLDPLRRLEVALAVGDLVWIGGRKAERLPLPRRRSKSRPLFSAIWRML